VRLVGALDGFSIGSLMIVGSLVLVPTIALADESPGETAGDVRQPGIHAVVQPSAAQLSPSTPDPERWAPSIRATPLPKMRPASFELPAPQPLSPGYIGDERLLQPLTNPSGLTRPTALAADHFDPDGILDLLSGYTGPDGHRLTLHRGDLDAAFLTPGRVFELPAAPDFIGTGDFDNDGYRDAVIAALGGESLFLLSGDGHGGFEPARAVALDGALTTMISGEINRRDGLADLVVGTTGPNGSAVFVFESPTGALMGEPERIALPASPTALVLGRFDDAGPLDLALGVGREVMILRGRDRQLTLHAQRRNGVGPAVVERVAELDAPVASIAAGEFVWNARRRQQLAVLSTAGTLHVLGRGSATDAEAWNTIGEDRVLEGVVPGPRLVTARVSALPLDEVLVLDRDGQSLGLSLGEVPLDGEPLAGSFGLARVAELAGPPVAVLPMHLNRDALNDLVVLQEGMLAPAMLPSAPAAAIAVTGPTDAGFPVQVGDGLCQLSEAITNANANADMTGGDCAAGAGVDLIFFPTIGSVAVATPLPPLTDPGDSIDGISGPAFCTDIEGATFGSLGDGLTLLGGSHSVRGVAIWGFAGDGVHITAPGTASIVDGTFIGAACAAIATTGNGGDGIDIRDSASNLIGGPGGPPQSFILDNGANGVAIRESFPGASAGNVVISNFIGTTGAGLPRPNASDGIRLENTDGATIGGTAPGEGNTISGNGFHGIEILSIVDPGTGNLIQGNFIGTNPAGAFAMANSADGIRITDGDSNLIGGTSPAARNVISGNTGEGVFLFGGGFGGSIFNKVQGNHIGVDVFGGAPVGNGSLGVRVEDSSDNLIGGAVPGAGNVVSANALFGIGVVTFTNPGLVHHNTVQGNLIGLDAGGGASLGHLLSGIIVQDSSSNLVGGGFPGEGNVCSGNGQTGVFVTASNFPPIDTTDNHVAGNYIGTDVTGTAPVGNGLSGVAVQEAVGNRVGGTLPGEGNLISGNLANGVFIGSFLVPGGSANNTVEGNVIGLDASGLPLPNSGSGVLIQDAPDNSIGGTVPGSGNTIHANAGPGVSVRELAPFPTTGNRIVGNSIFGNSSLGIDLLDDGIAQANDPLDPDLGPNGVQNHPIVTRADVGLSETVIEGIVDGAPGTNVRVELFSSPACDPSGTGEGRDYRTFVDVSTDAVGFGAFSVIVPTTIGVGLPITATSTDNGLFDTSEFSPCFPVSPCVPVVFGQTVSAQDKNTLVWPVSENANWVKGPLAFVSNYMVLGGGQLLGTSLNISADNPGPGAGMYYALRQRACGSWQTVLGAEPPRDVLLP